ISAQGLVKEVEVVGNAIKACPRSADEESSILDAGEAFLRHIAYIDALPRVGREGGDPFREQGDGVRVYECCRQGRHLIAPALVNSRKENGVFQRVWPYDFIDRVAIGTGECRSINNPGFIQPDIESGIPGCAYRLIIVTLDAVSRQVRTDPVSNRVIGVGGRGQRRENGNVGYCRAKITHPVEVINSVNEAASDR